LKSHYNISKKKIEKNRKKYLFIKMSFYLFIKILSAKMSSVYMPLEASREPKRLGDTTPFFLRKYQFVVSNVFSKKKKLF